MPTDRIVLRDLLRRVIALESVTPADTLTGLLTVDGTGSGLDADKLDGYEASALAKYADMDGQGGALQSFQLQITNNAGTLQHRIGAWNSGSAAADLASKISSASNSYTNTPTGTDSSTAFAAGGKISSVNTNRFIFDVANAQDLGATTVATFFVPSSGMPATLRMSGGLSNDNVYGTTRVRPAISFSYHNGTDWTAWALDTTNIASSKTLSVQVFALLK